MVIETSLGSGEVTGAASAGVVRRKVSKNARHHPVRAEPVEAFPFFFALEQERGREGFDKLSPNGWGVSPNGGGVSPNG